MADELRSDVQEGGDTLSTSGPPLLTRRSFAAAATAALPLVATAWRIAQADPPPDTDRSQSLFLGILCDTVLPATETPGARSAGVPDFIGVAFQHGLFAGDGETVATLQSALDARSGGSNFTAASPAKQRNLIVALDAQTFAADTAAADLHVTRLWRSMKEAIVVGYYTSKAGASVELAYAPVPGRYDADIPLVAGTPCLSNDWMANLF